jgi:hypothetical protein
MSDDELVAEFELDEGLEAEADVAAVFGLGGLGPVGREVLFAEDLVDDAVVSAWGLGASVDVGLFSFSVQHLHGGLFGRPGDAPNL